MATRRSPLREGLHGAGLAEAEEDVTAEGEAEETQGPRFGHGGEGDEIAAVGVDLVLASEPSPTPGLRRGFGANGIEKEFPANE